MSTRSSVTRLGFRRRTAVADPRRGAPGSGSRTGRSSSRQKPRRGPPAPSSSSRSGSIPGRAGRATPHAGIADLCRLLLERTPTVCLFVRPENAAAIRLYDRSRHAAGRHVPQRPFLSCDTLRLVPLLHGTAGSFGRRSRQDIREHELIAPGGEVTCLVSGGADSTCLWHVLRELGYDGLRAPRRPRSARPRVRRGRRVLPRSARSRGRRRTRWRHRRRAARDPLLVRHRSAARDRPHRLRPGRDGPLPHRRLGRAGPHRPAPGRRSRPAPCSTAGVTTPRRTASPRASTFAGTPRTRTRSEGLSANRSCRCSSQLHPAAEGNLLRLADRKTAPPELVQLLDSIEGSTRLDLGGGRAVVREYDQVWLERSPWPSTARSRWGAWRIASDQKGLKVRGWRPGDRLAGRTKKIQDVFVDAKIPRSEREAWPLVVGATR